MKAKRLIALALATVFMLSAAATPVFAAAALPQENAALEQQNDMVSIRLKATGDLVYGSNYKLEVQTNPADTQYIGVVVGVGGEANGYVTLVLSDKIRTLLKMIPLPQEDVQDTGSGRGVQCVQLPQAADRRQRCQRAAAGWPMRPSR